MNSSGQSGSKLEFDKIHDALEKSTTRNSRQLLSFVLIQLYLLITVAATTDLQLLLPDSKVLLPLLNVELPLFGFYIVAPALIVIFHFHYLLNLLQHARKLKAWDEIKSNQQKVLLPGFIFNFSILFKQITVNYRLLRFLQAAILSFFPLLLLLFIQIRFADYHSVPMTSWHSALVLLDFLVLLIFWYRINYPELLNEKYDALMILLSIFTSRRKKKGKEKEQERTEAVASRGYLWLFAMVQLVSLSCLLVVVLLNFNYFEARHFFTPYISTPGAYLVKPPSELTIQAYAFQGKNIDSASIELEQGIDLRGRKLQFANLSQANLRKVTLSFANLSGANLSGAILNGAHLDSALLNGAILDSSLLNGAHLDSAQLNRASLKYAELNGAYLTEAAMNGAVLTDAQMNLADLTGAQMNGADFGRAQLNGAILYSAQLNGANINFAHLNGANLSYAELDSADLDGTELNDANLSNTILNGAFLQYAQLNGANLWRAQLNGAMLYSAQLNGAYLRHVELNTADLNNAQLNGACLVQAQLNGVELRSAQLNGASLLWAQLNGAEVDTAQLNGTYFGETMIRGCNFSQIEKRKGLFFETAFDTVSVPDWDYIVTAIENSISKPFLKERSMARLIIAIENSKYLDPVLNVLTPDLAGFIEVRQELSCQSQYIAKGMLMQSLSMGTKAAQVTNGLILHMYHECPDTLASLQSLVSVELAVQHELFDEYEEISNKIDSIIQGTK